MSSNTGSNTSSNTNPNMGSEVQVTKHNRANGDSGDVKAAYDRWHEEIADREAEDGHDSPWHGMAKRHLGDIRGRRVLEIGCGRGGFSRYLLEQGAHLTAADFSPSAVDITRRLLRDAPGCETLVAATKPDATERKGG